MEFETRLENLHKSRRTPVHETDAAVNVYERLLTARTMCESVFGSGTSAETVASVMLALSEEARFIMLSEERLLAEGADDSPE